MVLTHDSSDTARLIAVRLHWIAGLLLALEIATSACKTTPTAPTPEPPVQMPGDNPGNDPAPRTTSIHLTRVTCGHGR